MKDLLKYYVALQPKFKETMGKLEDYDKAVFIEESDMVHRYVSNSNIGVSMCIAEDYGRLIRIPRTIDDSSPEAQKRSLWGMVDWRRFNMHLSESGEVCINTRLLANPLPIIWAATPTEAILKALCAQEGAEVI
jgi:hypothetical protein